MHSFSFKGLVQIVNMKLKVNSRTLLYFGVISMHLWGCQNLQFRPWKNNSNLVRKALKVSSHVSEKADFDSVYFAKLKSGGFTNYCTIFISRWTLNIAVKLWMSYLSVPTWLELFVLCWEWGFGGSGKVNPPQSQI